MTVETPMKVTAIAPWFGGKRNLASEIVRELGQHSAYFEPFCGSMAVLLAKPKCPMEIVNDLNGELINLATVISDPVLGPQLYRRLRRQTMTEFHFDFHRGRIPAEDKWDGVPDVDRAESYFYASWIGRNGVAGTRGRNIGFSARYTKNGGHAGRRFCSAVDSIPAFRRRLREVTVMYRDGIAMLEKIDDGSGIAIYCDPPYFEKGATYIHDFDDLHHDQLAEVIRRFKKSRVVVSYYDHPRIEELYNGWTVRRIDVSKSMSHGGKRGDNDVRATELLLINGPSYAEPEENLFAESA